MQFRTLASVLVASILFTTVALAGGKINVDSSSGLAIQGYDPVAYFTEERAVEGSPEIIAEHGGATWAFSSEAHRQAFQENPDQYTPEYGGFCAYAAGLNAVAPVDPTAWTVFEGKLYLNYNEPTKGRWLGKRDYYIAEGDKNWPALSE